MKRQIRTTQLYCLFSSLIILGFGRFTSSRVFRNNGTTSSVVHKLSTSHANFTCRSSKLNQTLNKLLLSVPFYVYDELDWLNATWMGEPVTMYSDYKHSEDYWVIVNALKHPMRTTNASKAKLFVIPMLQNFFDRRAFAFFEKRSAIRTSNLCLRSLCNDELMLSAAEVVTSSPYFQSHPQAHLLVVSHWAYHLKHPQRWWKKKPTDLYFSMVNNSSNIHFENNPKNNGWSAPSMYVGNACPVQENNKTHDVAMIATFKPKDPNFSHRETICKWLNNQTTTNQSSISVARCGGGAMCPALANAKLGFHVRGDTPGANRLVDTILSGTVPIFTMSEQYDILPPWIDWRRISYFIDIARVNETQFIQELTGILEDKVTLDKKLDLILANRPLFDWTSLFPFDTYMYMLQKHLYPETQHAAATFFAPIPSCSILLL